MSKWLEKDSFDFHMLKNEISSQDGFPLVNIFPKGLGKTEDPHFQSIDLKSKPSTSRSSANSQSNKNNHLTLFPLNSNGHVSAANTRTTSISTSDRSFLPNPPQAPDSANSFAAREPKKKTASKKKGSEFLKKIRPAPAASNLQSASSSEEEKQKNVRIRLHSKPEPSPKLLSGIFLYAIRLLILGIGIGAIAGTILFHIDRNRPTIANSISEPTPARRVGDSERSNYSSPSLSLGEELTTLKEKIEAVAAKYPQLETEAFFVDLDNGAYVDIQGEKTISAASTIKIPILIAFFEDVDAGKIHLDEMLTMTPETIGGGSGGMQYQTPGKQFSALYTATQTIVLSDNTATNMLVARLGGPEALNQRFMNWGLKTTAINNLLPDLEGTNTTSPKDLVGVLAKIEKGELISLRSRDRALGIMRETRTRTLLPQGLEKDAIIAHKTGDIGSILADAGVIDLPNGKRYLASVMVRRPHNDYTARVLIQEISKTAYQHFKWYKPSSFAKK